MRDQLLSKTPTAAFTPAGRRSGGGWWLGVILLLAATGCDPTALLTPPEKRKASLPQAAAAPSGIADNSGHTRWEERPAEDGTGSRLVLAGRAPGSIEGNPDDVLGIARRFLTSEERKRLAQEARERTEATLPPDDGTDEGRHRRRRALLSLQERQQRLQQIIKQPDDAHLAFAHSVLSTPNDPLAPLAAVAMGRIGGIGAEQSLMAATRDARWPVRETALSGLADMRSPHALPEALRLLESDPVDRVRAAAAVTLGVLQANKAREPLRRHMEEDALPVRYAAAWALARMRDDAGLDMLESLAVSGDGPLASRAILTLGLLRSERSAPAFYRCLFSPHEKIRMEALAALEVLPPAAHEKALAPLSQVERSRLKLRRRMLRCAVGRGPFPPEAILYVTEGGEDDRRLAIQCINRHPTKKAFAPLIEALDDRDEDVRHMAQRVLHALAKHFDMPATPDRFNGKAWRLWWLRQHVLAAATRERALVLVPDGTQRDVKVGDILAFDIQVKRIQPGGGETGTDYGFVGIEAGGLKIQITKDLNY